MGFFSLNFSPKGTPNRNLKSAGQSQYSGAKGRWIFEFEASLVYKVTFRTVRSIQGNPVSKNKTKQTVN